MYRRDVIIYTRDEFTNIRDECLTNIRDECPWILIWGLFVWVHRLLLYI
jgi:hypothetical protein